MHIIYLAIIPDILSSFLLLLHEIGWTFEDMFLSYFRFCEDGGVDDRADKRVFSAATLRPGKNDQYVALSQKLLSASAARYTLFWLAAFCRDLVSQGGVDGLEELSLFGFDFGHCYFLSFGLGANLNVYGLGSMV